MVSEIFEVGGKGHSVGIASFDDDHIHRLASMAPVSRIMVRQPNVRGNAGSFTNGMPQTASLGCGTWGGNITSENISVKHYMNTTWVSRPIPEDKPSEQELLGEFYNSEVFEPETVKPNLPVWRSLLYVPVNVEHYVEKAHTRGADCIQLDLEDSVPASEKDAARARSCRRRRDASVAAAPTSSCASTARWTMTRQGSRRRRSAPTSTGSP